MREIPYVRWAGVDIALAGGAMASRRLYDHEIVYVLSGAGSVVWGEHEYSSSHAAAADSCFFHLPRMSHTSSNAHDIPWVTLGVHFDWCRESDVECFPTFRADDMRGPTDATLFRAPQAIAGWDTAAQPILDLRGRPMVRHFLEEVVTAFARGDENARSQAGGLLFAAICQIQREVRLFQSGCDSGVIGPDAQRRLNDARWLLEQVGPKMTTVADVAARVGWSADYLSFMVKTAFGVLPRQLRMNARLTHARRLLREGESVAEVARQCGFADTSHLARAFGKDSGLTPREYSALAGRHE